MEEKQTVDTNTSQPLLQSNIGKLNLYSLSFFTENFETKMFYIINNYLIFSSIYDMSYILGVFCQ